jgi:hypothetical protein
LASFGRTASPKAFNFGSGCTHSCTDSCSHIAFFACATRIRLNSNRGYPLYSYEVGTTYDNPFEFDGSRCLSSIVVLYTPAFLYIFTVRVLTSPIAWWMARRGTPWLLAGTRPPMQLAGTFLSDRVWLLACFGLFQRKRIENPYTNMFKPVSQEALEVTPPSRQRLRGVHVWIDMFSLSGRPSVCAHAMHGCVGLLTTFANDANYFRFYTPPSLSCLRLTSL